MNKTGKENLIIINGSKYVHCPVCGTVTAVYDILTSVSGKIQEKLI
nr:MAG TPA: protein of unknown function (DUF3797) [Caudoviricetes sp.]